ncbi:MAG: hypothetical protein FWC03_03665 [Treponema sp.]|nr:hypothetical protein [Treponema sp.]
MANKGNAIYEPGELNRVRQKLGVDNDEAKRMAQLLGGEVGTERNKEPEKSKKNIRRETVDVVIGGKNNRTNYAFGGSDESGRENKSKNKNEVYPGDDPAAPLKLSYRERVKIDQYAGQAIFDIKSPKLVFISIFSFFRAPIDYVSPRFVNKRMNDYFNKLEKLITLTRNLFPRIDIKRNNQLKRASPAAFRVIDIIRSWNIETIAREMTELQSHPRTVMFSDFNIILREIYKPLCILEELDTENIKTVYRLIYKILYIESPMDAKTKYQDIIRSIVVSLTDVRRDVHFGMYPLLMKLISDRYIPYERFFIERHRRFLAFLGITSADQLKSADLNLQQIENIDTETLQKEMEALQAETEAEGGKAEGEKTEGENAEEENPEVNDERATVVEDLNDPAVVERKAFEEAERADKKILDQGLATMETLFPKAGWDKLSEFPDLYPYFANVFNLRHGYELIAPTDPLQQISILMHVLEDLFYAMRFITFGTITGPDGSPEKIHEEMNEMFHNWRSYIDNSFIKGYLPKLTEYCRMLENSAEARNSVYAKKCLNELHWLKRLFFVPYYKFESLGPPPFQKQDVTSIYSQTRKLRKNLTAVAAGIEQGVYAGGMSAKAPCDGINNPWVHYNFQVPNAISRRLGLMLPQEKRINATLIFFSLAAVTVLDHIINNENSWAYDENRPGPLFRSIKNEGLIPQFGVDEKLDADKIFRESLLKNT